MISPGPSHLTRPWNERQPPERRDCLGRYPAVRSAEPAERRISGRRLSVFVPTLPKHTENMHHRSSLCRTRLKKPALGATHARPPVCSLVWFRNRTSASRQPVSPSGPRHVTSAGRYRTQNPRPDGPGPSDYTSDYLPGCRCLELRPRCRTPGWSRMRAG